ncbi:MAG: hydrogenase maturation protease [Anaerolineales bacterium]|nr:MAG: hydrogenase maturation protease [Anaerolineales bacterium]
MWCATTWIAAASVLNVCRAAAKLAFRWLTRNGNWPACIAAILSTYSETQRIFRMSWTKTFEQALIRLNEHHSPLRIAVVGLGHPLLGDDAAGHELAHRLKEALQDHEDVLVVASGSVPENVSGSLRRFWPDLVILIDAAELGEEPGSMRWIPWQEASCCRSSSHSLPLRDVCAYWQQELLSEIWLLGIQPSAIRFDTPLSPTLRSTIDSASKKLISLLDLHHPARRKPEELHESP